MPVSNLSSALASMSIHNGSAAGNSNREPFDRVKEYIAHPPPDGVSLFSHKSAPNGFKIAAILAELGVRYRTFYLDFQKSEQKSPYFVALNPNARVPAIIDHDRGNLAVWESGAIVLYLCQRCPDTPLWSRDVAEQSAITSWVFFQASGHSPMVGQALQFKYFHSEKIESAIVKYTEEVRRVYSVVEMTLAEKREQALEDSAGHVWLVGERITVADVSFVTWNQVVDKIGIDLKSEFPEVFLWTAAMLRRPRIASALAGLP